MEQFPYHPYYAEEARRKHPEVLEEWVSRVVRNPQRTEVQIDGRLRYYGYIPEADKWLRVIVEDGKLLNRFFDGAKMKQWGRP